MATVGGSKVIEERTGWKVEWLSWEGRPEGVPFLNRTEEELQKNYREIHKPLADKYGVPILLARKKCRTDLAHQATYFAREGGKLQPFRDAVYAARWVEDRDIADAEVLADIAQKVGLDADALRQALAEGRYRQHLAAQRKEGESLGVRGIPSFIVNGKVYWGKDVVDEVVAAVEESERKKG